MLINTTFPTRRMLINTEIERERPVTVSRMWSEMTRSSGSGTLTSARVCGVEDIILLWIRLFNHRRHRRLTSLGESLLCFLIFQVFNSSRIWNIFLESSPLIFKFMSPSNSFSSLEPPLAVVVFFLARLEPISFACFVLLFLSFSSYSLSFASFIPDLGLLKKKNVFQPLIS